MPLSWELCRKESFLLSERKKNQSTHTTKRSPVVDTQSRTDEFRSPIDCARDDRHLQQSGQLPLRLGGRSRGHQGTVRRKGAVGADLGFNYPTQS